MTVFPDSHLDLLDGPHTAAIITVGADGRPQTSAVWFLRRDDVIEVSITTDRQKYRNLVARPGVGLFVLDPTNPQRYIEIRGDAEIRPDPEKDLVRAVVEKHGQDPERYLARVEDRVIVTIRPTRVVTLAR
ncbi:MAG: PPOX class F420-dependent oxidoreductase [Actinomycetota bacterium]